MSGSLSVDNIESLDYINLGGVNPINVNGGQFGGTWSFLNQPTIPGYLTTSTWATADSTTNYASRIAFVSVSNTAAASLASNVWAAADSTTNYAPRTSFVSVSNTVVALGTNVAARLASNVWASADSTTNYALRTTFVEATNSLQTNVNARLASNVWAAADSTTNYASRITFNATSNALNSSITSLAARAFVYSTNLTAIAGSGLGVTSNQLVVTNIPTTFEALTGNNFVLGVGVLTNISATATGAFVAARVTGTNSIGDNSFGSSQMGLIDGEAAIGNFNYGSAQRGFIGGTATIGNTAHGISQIGWFSSGGAATIGGGSHAAYQRLRVPSGGVAEIGTTAIGATQIGGSSGRMIIGNGATAAMQMGSIVSGSSATNNAIGALQIMGGMSSETYLTTTNGRGSILVGPGTNDVAYSVRAAGGFFGNAAGLTNFPSSILTVSAGNAAYWRITTAPTGATSSGSSGQMAVSGTNLFIYSPNALGVGTGRWLRVSGDVSW